jgi:hypothetical protein
MIFLCLNTCKLFILYLFMINMHINMLIGCIIEYNNYEIL